MGNVIIAKDVDYPAGIVEQHEELAATVNALGVIVRNHLVGGAVHGADHADLINRLIKCASAHFDFEDRHMTARVFKYMHAPVMIQSTFDALVRHQNRHIGEHRSMLNALRLYQRQVVNNPESAIPVYSFASHWLALHLLTTDKWLSHWCRFVDGLPSLPPAIPDSVEAQVMQRNV